MHRIVVSDSTALIHLSRIGALHLLRGLYVQIVVPEAVYDEVARRGTGYPGALSVANASWINPVKVSNRAVVQRLREKLDLGESEAIALAQELHADVLIIDEVAGRNAAKQCGQKIIGMVGVLLAAKKQGLIFEIRSYLSALEQHGFHLGAAVRALALKQAGEADGSQQA